MEVYSGLTATFGKNMINVHFIRDGIVYFGQYHADADEFPEKCIGLKRQPKDDFLINLKKSVNDGTVLSSMVKF